PQGTPGHPGPQGFPSQPPVPRRRPRTALTVALTAAVTLVVAASLTWVVSATTASSARISPASGLPTDDPCAVVSDRTLASMDGEAERWSTSTYSNSCIWNVTMAENDDVRLSLSRHVPLSSSDAVLREEREPQGLDVPTDADELFALTVESASDASNVQQGEVTGTWDRPLRFGDEGSLVLTNIQIGGGRDSHLQRVNLVVREGRLVSVFLFQLSDSTEIDLDEAEDLLADVAADAFG
uniref:hypothetical protein n=1 Tax=Nocardiopsis sp. SBT366 TaxID=1580529 RepID=UPI00066E1F9A